MVFVADDLAAWLIGLLADAGRKKLTELVLGSDQDRALRSAATNAVQLTAAELRPEGGERAEQLAMVVSHVFSEPVPTTPLSRQATLLEALQAGVTGQLAVLADASLTGTGESAADALGIPATVLAEKLTGYLVREIVVRGAGGGPLTPLADQLNHDFTHLQGQQLEGMMGRLAKELREVLARLDIVHAVPMTPTQLPQVVAGFTGRDGELAVLAGLLDPAGLAGPAVSVVAGLPGVGKTSLAVEAGHAARRKGWFGGGVLFINLHGYDETPVEPAQALDTLLRALGVSAEQIPPRAEDRAGLYRSVLAQKSEPVLVIADNASSEAQVGYLLPGAGLHKAVVTSRHILAGLGARLIDVAILNETAAVGLLDGSLRAARPQDDRITASPEAAKRLAAACGGLPLALQITGALLKSDLALNAAELAEELAVESARMDQLAYDDGSGRDAPSVAAAFELSYRRLEEIPARVFRLLPVNPGPDVTTTAAAVLADLPVNELRRALAGLVRAHLVEAAASGPSRWRLHDLLRLYAQRLCGDHKDADDREDARDRLLRYYLNMADAADDHLRAPDIAKPDQDSALAWLDAECANMVAAVAMAAHAGPVRWPWSFRSCLPDTLIGGAVSMTGWPPLLSAWTCPGA